MQKNATPCPAFLDSGNTAAEQQRDFFTPMEAFTSTSVVSAFHWPDKVKKESKRFSPIPSLLQLKHFSLLLQSF